MLRYIKEEHGYGKFTSSGAMIGYVESMEFAEILTEINQCAKEERITSIGTPVNGWQKNGISILHQTLDRPQVEPSPFDLRHLWVDLRGNHAVA